MKKDNSISFASRAIHAFGLILAINVLAFGPVAAQQDTLRMSWPEFMDRGLQNAAQLDMQQTEIRMAQNQVDKARNKKWFPQIDLRTNHGLVPGVVSDSVRSKQYLDPDLGNDWSDWGIFTEIRISALQPIYTWGALDNAISAAEKGVEARRHQYESKEKDWELRLYKLYHSHILASEMRRIVDDAENTIDKAEKKIKEMEESGDSDLDYSEVYKFEIYKTKFNSKATEARENSKFVERAWQQVVHSDTSTRVLPTQKSLQRVRNEIRAISYYQQRAYEQRNDIEALDAAEQASKMGYEAQKAQRWPMVYLGLGGEFVNRPRPASDQPLFGDRFTYANVIYSFGIRQNLDFSSIKNSVDQSYHQYQKAQYSKDAAMQGIRLQINEQYKKVQTRLSQMENSQKALQKSKEWVRQEELDYDLGIGEMKDLIEAVRTRLETEAEHLENIYKFNVALAELYRKAGISLNKVQL